jgi:heme-degrading monooxygenase HmoA
MWEARAVPGRAADLAAWAAATQLPPGAGGLLGGRAYLSLDGPDRVVVIADWRDEAALAAFAGPGWRTAAPVDAAGEALLAGPARVWHFVPQAVGTVHG